MSRNPKFTALRSAGLLALGTLVVAAAAALLLRGAPAQAQGAMSAPACQCSAPVSISGMSSFLSGDRLQFWNSLLRHAGQCIVLTQYANHGLA